MIKRAILTTAFFALPALAQVQPSPGEGDPHVQWIKYDAEQVVVLRVSSGYALLVELAPGERIDTIAIGNGADWQVTAGKRGDFFVVKNIASGAHTNLSVVSDSRTYNFELVAVAGYGDVSPYNVRFRYGSPVAMADATEEPEAFAYKVSGAKRIRPSRIMALGGRTVIEWPETSPMPAIFMVENGEESLVNGEMQDGQFVVAGNPEKLVFRLDKSIATATRYKPKERVQ